MLRSQVTIVAGALALFVAAPRIAVPEPLQSGPQAGDKPQPFTSNMVTGPHRGQQYCYVCELKDEPALLVFARGTDAATGRLLRALQAALQERRGEKLFGWVVFLGKDDTPSETALERQAYDLARRNEATNVVVSALGDLEGPPGYRIAPDAAATVILFRSGKILYNRAYRAREWTPRTAETALKEPLRMVGSPAPAQ
jgi:hypothetical protein